MTILPGASDTIGVTFRPMAGIAYDGTLDLVSSPPLSVPLTGGAIGSVFLALPNPLELGRSIPAPRRRTRFASRTPATATLTIFERGQQPSGVLSEPYGVHDPAGSERYAPDLLPSAGRWTGHSDVLDRRERYGVPHEVSVRGEARANVAVNTPPPAAFALSQNQPNPFGGATTSATRCPGPPTCASRCSTSGPARRHARARIPVTRLVHRALRPRRPGANGARVARCPLACTSTASSRVVLEHAQDAVRAVSLYAAASHTADRHRTRTHRRRRRTGTPMLDSLKSLFAKHAVTRRLRTATAAAPTWACASPRAR